MNFAVYRDHKLSHGTVSRALTMQIVFRYNATVAAGRARERERRVIIRDDRSPRISLLCIHTMYSWFRRLREIRHCGGEKCGKTNGSTESEILIIEKTIIFNIFAIENLHKFVHSQIFTSIVLKIKIF